MPPPISNSRFPFEGPLVDFLFRRRPEYPPNDFQNHRILVVYNPRARLGAYAKEADSLKQQLEAMGFEVTFLETVKDPAERLRLIRETSRPLLEDGESRPLHVLPLGGDTTVDEVVREVVQNVTGPLHEIPAESTTANEALQKKLASVIVLRTGTAADIANQLNAPPRFFWLRTQWNKLLRRPLPTVFGEVPNFLRGTQTIPQGIASIRTPEIPEASAFHSVDFGTGGYLFELGDRNREANPNDWRNRGIFNYLRVTPQAIREYGLRGLDVEISHHGRVDRFKVGDVLGSTSRTIAGVGGIPGRWGEFKILAIPSGPRGIATMLEALARGIPTIYLGGNFVGAGSDFWTLPREREITLRPGERATLRFFDPVSGLPTKAPWQSNGGAMSQHVSEAEIYVPPVSVQLQADPEGLGTRLYQQDELRRGLAMGGEALPEGFPMSRMVSPPQYYENPWGGRGASSGFYPESDLRSLAVGLDIEPTRIPLLVARAHGIQTADDLKRLETNPMSMEAIDRWARSEEGVAVIQQNKSLWGDSFRNRLETHAPGLLMGAATMYATNRLAKGIGIDPERDPFLHFAFTSLSSHGMNQVGNAGMGVLINRWRGIPYDFAMMETRSASSLMASRMMYEYNSNTLNAVRMASMRSLGFQGGARSILWRGVKSVFTVPGRMAWGMGAGLACSRLTDRFLRDFPGMSEQERYYISSAAFFAPTVYPILFGNRGISIVESGSFRWMNRAFAAGFIADLVFTGVHSLIYGEEASAQRFQNHVISEMRERREQRGFWSFHGITSLLAPEMAAWWDARA